MDGLTVKELAAYLRDHWRTIREQLLAGRYQPSAGAADGDSRNRTVGCGCWASRPCSIGSSSRPCYRSCNPRSIQRSRSTVTVFGRAGVRSDAVCQAQRYVQEDRHWVVDVDLAQFFDRVNHDILMGLLAKRIADPRVLTLIRRYLEAGVMATGVVVKRYEGTPQGGPLSPLLANVLLDVVDKELERRGHAFVRYADDCNVYVESRRAAERVMEGLVGLYAKLKLRINPAKSAVAPVADRTFLGFRFWRVVRGRIVKRRVAPKAIDNDEGAGPRANGAVQGVELPTGGCRSASVSARLEGVFPVGRDAQRVCGDRRMDSSAPARADH